MTDRVCPICGKRTLEEHGTEAGDHHWWLCRTCGTMVDDAKSEEGS